MSKAIEVFRRTEGFGWELRKVGSPAWRWGYCSTQEGAWGNAKREARQLGGIAIMLSKAGRVRRIASYQKGGRP